MARTQGKQRKENKHQNVAWGVRFGKSSTGCDLDLDDERKESGYSIRLIKE